MISFRKKYLVLHSNINNYKFTIYDSYKKLCYNINNPISCIAIRTNCPNLEVSISPTLSQNNITFYYNVDLANKNKVNLFFDFYSDEENINYFTLTDKKYGFPLDGRLQFIKT